MPPTPKLYQLPEEWALIDLELDSIEGGEVPPEILERMDRLDGTLADKTDSIAMMARQALANADAIGEEIRRLQAMKRREENRAEGLKSYLMHCLRRMDLDGSKGRIFRVRIQRNSAPSIAWRGPGDPPEAFQRVRVELDGEKAREVVKAGGMLPEGFEVKHGEHLRIE